MLWGDESRALEIWCPKCVGFTATGAAVGFLLFRLFRRSCTVGLHISLGDEGSDKRDINKKNKQVKYVRSRSYCVHTEYEWHSCRVHVIGDRGMGMHMEEGHVILDRSMWMRMEGHPRMQMRRTRRVSGRSCKVISPKVILHLLDI